MKNNECDLDLEEKLFSKYFKTARQSSYVEIPDFKLKEDDEIVKKPKQSAAEPAKSPEKVSISDKIAGIFHKPEQSTLNSNNKTPSLKGYGAPSFSLEEN